jgi:hypothetical protein
MCWTSSSYCPRRPWEKLSSRRRWRYRVAHGGLCERATNGINLSVTFNVSDHRNDSCEEPNGTERM